MNVKRNITLLCAVILLLLSFNNACTSEPSIQPSEPDQAPTMEQIAPTRIEKQNSTETETIPTSESITPEPTPLLSAMYPDILWLPILDALEEGLIKLSITGDGLEEIDVVVNPNIDTEIGIAFTPGLIFQTNTVGVQSMVLIEFLEVILKPETEIKLELDVACANMELEAPEESDSFRISQTENLELNRLAWVISELYSLPLDFTVDFRPKQFAVWVLTNNPKRDEMRGLTVGFSPYGSGPSDEEISIMKALFVGADIPYEDYQIFKGL